MRLQSNVLKPDVSRPCLDRARVLSIAHAGLECERSSSYVNAKGRVAPVP